MGSRVKKGFSVAVSIAFTVNYVVGAGSLTIPWAFYQAGSGLGILMLGVMGFFSFSAVLFLLETMARADTLMEIIPSTARLSATSAEEQPLLAHPSSSPPKQMIGSRKFEVSELCEIFLGPIGKAIYILIISIYMYGTLWAYATVFSNALSAHFPLGISSYYLYLALFACLALPVSCMELNGLVSLLVTLSLCRILMILLMLSTLLLSRATATQAFPEFGVISHASFFAADSSKLYILLPITAYANIFHHSLPSLSHPVDDKSKLVTIFGATILSCLIAYSLIGSIISTYFGALVKSSSNLNWMSYNGGGLLPTKVAEAISFYIVCFPALDVASAFPVRFNVF